MDDESGGDSKLLAVPEDKILPMYNHWPKPEDMNPQRLNAIQHFFEHYKDLEAGKWVKVLGWEGPRSAKQEILDGIRRYRELTPMIPRLRRRTKRFTQG
jgi:inorganic pyrophosphatase